MKLTDVARASLSRTDSVGSARLSELRGDFAIFILDRGGLPWSCQAPEAKEVNAASLDAPMFTGNRVHKSARHARQQLRDDARWLDSEDPLVVADAMRIIIGRALKMLKAPIKAQGAAFERAGGFSERWVARRLAARDGNAPGGPAPRRHRPRGSTGVAWLLARSFGATAATGGGRSLRAMRRPRLVAACLVLIAFLSKAVAAPPNVIVILVDDLGWADLGCQGSQYHQTPHIDAMAREGMRFTDAYSACTVCSPTRAALLTGKHPARLHLTDWIAGHAAPKAKLSPPEWSQRLDPSEPTLASRLKSSGYATAAVGKWHLGANSRPQQFGFDVNHGGDHRGQPPRYVSPYSLPELPDGPQGEFLTDRESAEAIRFIEAQQGKPFFLYLAHYAVHTPLDGKREVVAKYKARTPDDQRNAVYAALLESVDDSVGKLRATLQRLGIATNTVVVLTSDNGGLVLGKDRPTSNRPLRSGKGDVYEGGVRVPFIVCWPGVVRPGTTSSRPVQTMDLYPTLLEAAGVADAPGHEVDGTSLVGLLRGKGSTPDRSLYWHYPHYHPGGATPYGAVRSGDWKLVEFYESGHLELYNLASDLGEATDLANALPEKANELARELAAWRKKVGAQMPVPNPAHVPAAIAPQPDGTFVLPAHRALTHGAKLQYEPPAHKNTIGYWVEAGDWVEWVVQVPTPGRYEVEILQGCGTGSGGSEVEVALAGSRLPFVVMETGGFQKFMPRRLGDIDIANPGEHRLQIRVQRKAGPAVMDVRQVILRRKAA